MKIIIRTLHVLGRTQHRTDLSAKLTLTTPFLALFLPNFLVKPGKTMQTLTISLLSSSAVTVTQKIHNTRTDAVPKQSEVNNNGEIVICFASSLDINWDEKQ